MGPGSQQVFYLKWDDKSIWRLGGGRLKSRESRSPLGLQEVRHMSFGGETWGPFTFLLYETTGDGSREVVLGLRTLKMGPLSFVLEGSV